MCAQNTNFYKLSFVKKAEQDRQFLFCLLLERGLGIKKGIRLNYLFLIKKLRHIGLTKMGHRNIGIEIGRPLAEIRGSPN